MSSRIRIAAAGALLTWVALPAPPALAGGGCHTGVTYGDGTVVVMRDACFTPTILYVAPGTAVRFSNEDPLTHNVTANGWGRFDPMSQGDGFTANFDDPGIYPFACQYHPGMTGAVVVGDGKGGGNGGNVTVEPLASPSPETAGPAGPEAEVAAAAAPTPERSSLGWMAGGAVGLLVGAGLGTGAGIATRRRRRVD